MEEIDQVLDASGLDCPAPIIMTDDKLEGMAAGEALQLITTDEGTANNIREFCQQTGNTLVSSRHDDGAHIFVIRKSS